MSVKLIDNDYYFPKRHLTFQVKISIAALFTKFEFSFEAEELQSTTESESGCHKHTFFSGNKHWQIDK